MGEAWARWQEATETIGADLSSEVRQLFFRFSIGNAGMNGNCP